jgi:hypothetical protein
MKEPDDTARRIIRWALIVFCVLVPASAGIRQLEVVGAPCWGTLMVWGALLLVVIRRKRLSASIACWPGPKRAAAGVSEFGVEKS